MSRSEKQSSRVDLLVREDGFSPGYHIRRGNLVSILLEGSVSLDEICSWIDKSYQVTASAKTKQAARAPKKQTLSSAPMKKAKYDASRVDEADGLSAQPDDDR